MLAACRSLSRGGYEVTAGSYTMFAAAKWSRACARRVRIPDARDDADRFVDGVRRELMRRSYATLIPGSDSALLALSRGRAQVSVLTKLGLPSHEVVARALSRESLAEAAEHAGFAPSVSIRAGGLEQALAAARRLGFPVVLKSTEAASVGARAVSGVPKGQIVFSEGELRRTASAFGERLLVQRWAGDELISLGGVMAGGGLLALAASRYQRMWPPRSGSVTFSESIEAPVELEAMTQRLLADIGWEGLFELEVIRSQPQAHVAIDLNPRPYGSMALATAAGAPLAAIWCDWLLGRDPHPARARPGHRYRWEDGDIRHLAWQLRHGNLSAAMAPLRPRRAVTHAHFALTDPLPLLANGLYLGKRTAKQTRRADEPRRPAPSARDSSGRC